MVLYAAESCLWKRIHRQSDLCVKICDWIYPLKRLRFALLNLSLPQVKPQILSRHGNHLVYTSPYAAPGDSGGALLLEDGRVVGIHVEGINNLKERFRRKKEVEDRLTAVEMSIDAAIASISQGSVALLGKSFPAL